MKILTVKIKDDDWDVLADLVEDPEGWVNAAIAGKVNKSRKLMHGEWIPRLRHEGVAIPPDDASLEDEIKGHPHYKTRSQREEERRPIRGPAR
jgi:hypothetical protein